MRPPVLLFRSLMRLSLTYILRRNWISNSRQRVSARLCRWAAGRIRLADSNRWRRPGCLCWKGVRACGADGEWARSLAHRVFIEDAPGRCVRRSNDCEVFAGRQSPAETALLTTAYAGSAGAMCKPMLSPTREPEAFTDSLAKCA